MSGPPSLPPPPPPYPSEYDNAPPPGVPVSSTTPFAHQTSGFSWTSHLATPAYGSGNAAWPRLPSNHSPVGSYTLYSFVNEKVHGGQGVQSPPSYGGQIAMHSGEISRHGGQTITPGNGFAPNLIQAPFFPSSTSSTAAASVRPIAPDGHLKNLENIDVTHLVSNLRGLCDQVTQAVGKMVSLVKVMPHDLPRRSLDPKKVHNTTVSHVETVESVDSSKDFTHRRMEVENASDSNEFLKASMLFDDILKTLEERKSTSNAIFYRDAPGVVQIPAFPETERPVLPSLAIGESWAETSPQDTCKNPRCAQKGSEQASLLPSRFFQMRREISSWRDLPSKYTFAQLRAVVGLARVKCANLKSWLLTHLGSYGMKFSRCLVDNIVVLLILCLRAVQREGITITESQRNMSDAAPQSVDCCMLLESARWLVSQVSLVSDAAASKNLVLGIYKYALQAAARCLTFPQRGTNQDGQKEDIEEDFAREDGANPQMEPKSFNMILEDHTDTRSSSLSVGDGVLSLHQLVVSIFAIQQEAVRNKCERAELEIFHSSSAQKSMLHSMAVMKAEEVRAKRATYRAVLEHDGLIWHRQENEEGKKNKTKAEILAEERDYKRRRMSYRGKKVQRTPAQVLRDIIDSHMEEIIAAGGIGGFGQRPLELPLSQSKAELSQPGTKDSSFVMDKLRASSRDVPGKELDTSHLDYRKYSRSDSRVSFRNEREHRHRSTEQSSSWSSHRSRSPYERKQKYERSHDKLDRDRRYESGGKYSNWESRTDDREACLAEDRHHSRYQSKSRE